MKNPKVGDRVRRYGTSNNPLSGTVKRVKGDVVEWLADTDLNYLQEDHRVSLVRLKPLKTAVQTIRERHNERVAKLEPIKVTDWNYALEAAFEKHLTAPSNWPEYTVAEIRSSDPNDLNPAETLINEFNRLRTKENQPLKAKGLNLIEALKTRKPLRRPIAKHKGSGDDGWLGSEYVKDLLTGYKYAGISYDTHSENLVTSNDLMAEDWEVKEDD